MPSPLPHSLLRCALAGAFLLSCDGSPAADVEAPPARSGTPQSEPEPEPESTPTPEPGTTPSPAASAPTTEDGPIELAPLPLLATAPAGTTMEPGFDGGVLVRGPQLIVHVDPAPADAPATIEQAERADVLFSPENWRAEPVEGGHLRRFTNTGRVGTHHWVRTYQRLGNAAYQCHATVSTEAGQAAAASFCRSLRTSS